MREVMTNLLQNRFVFRMNNPEDARAEIGVMLSAYADAHRGTREARELTRFQPDMLVNLDVFYALCSWVAGGRRADAFLGRTIRPREDPDLIAHHERAQRERGAFVLERLPNLVAPNSWVRRSAVVGVDTAEETTAAPVPVDAAETSASAAAPAVEEASTHAPSPRDAHEAAVADRRQACERRRLRCAVGHRGRCIATASRTERAASPSTRPHRRRTVRPGSDRSWRPARGDRQPAGRHPYQPRAQLHRGRRRPAAAAQVRAGPDARRRGGAGPRRRARSTDSRRAARSRIPARPADRPALLGAGHERAQHSASADAHGRTRARRALPHHRRRRRHASVHLPADQGRLPLRPVAARPARRSHSSRGAMA